LSQTFEAQLLAQDVAHEADVGGPLTQELEVGLVVLKQVLVHLACRVDISL
jgi:hypothetical protein